MSVYIRPKITGATVFFTVTLAYRGSDLLIREIAALRQAVRATKTERPFIIDAWVVLPDHIHAVWTLPAGDRDYGVRWGAIKARFTRAVRAKYNDYVGPVSRSGFSPACVVQAKELPIVRSGRYAGLKPGLRHTKRESAIWQRRFWEHHIRDEADYAAHVRYCWINPVKHGLVKKPTDWPHSSINRDIALGRVEPEWSGTVPNGVFGEWV